MTNPYSPPQSERAESDHDGQLTEPVVIDLAMDTKYLTDAIERTRRRDPIRRLWMIARWPCAALLMITAVVLAFTAPFYWSIGFVVMTIGLFNAYRIDDLYYIWSMKRSGWLDATCRITMSDAGYRIQSKGFEMTVPWSSFRCADVFDDGVLFFQTSRSSPWIPWDSVASWNDRDRLLAFVRKTFATSYKMHSSRG